MNYFIFVGYLKAGGGEGVPANHLSPLWIATRLSAGYTIFIFIFLSVFLSDVCQYKFRMCCLGFF